MKNILKHAVPAIWILFGTLWGQHAAAAIDAKISFETEMPKAFVCGENSTAELSGLHYKDGSRSLRWSWSAPSTLRFNDFGQLMRSLRVKGAGVMLWIYNPRAVDADMRFSFETPTGEVPYRFDFHMDFTGWRACWIKYNDMPGDHASQQVSRLTISTPAGVESGELFLDRLTFSEVKLHDQITPDKQIPGNNCNLSRELWHWARLWEWEQYEYEEPLRDVTPAEKAQLDAVKSRIESIVAANMSSANSINVGRLVPQVVYYFAAYAQLLRAGAIEAGDAVEFCVPTGNFGDILAGYYAKRMGLPVAKLVVASDKNNVLADFLTTGVYDRNRPFFTTISPSMDILISSNLERMLYFLSDGDCELVAGLMEQLAQTGRYEVPAELLTKIQSVFGCGWASEDEVRAAIKSCWNANDYVIDPHTACGYHVFEQVAPAEGAKARVLLSTASPYKFPRACCDALGLDVPEDDFEAMRVLEQTTNTVAPTQLAELESKPVRFEDVCDVDEMASYIESAAKRMSTN